MVNNISSRFRGFLPVVMDLETGGLNPQKHALLELAAVIIGMDSDGKLYKAKTIHSNIKPFEGSQLDPEALKITGIQPTHPLRMAKDEVTALKQLFTEVKQEVNAACCSRAIMVAHNSSFDLGFLQAAITRNRIKNSPFHSFSSFDTVTLGGLFCGQTVLSKVAEYCGFDYDTQKAHGAKYDAELTADIFCRIVNSYNFMG